MGVKGLWQLLEPVGRPVTLESLEGKVLGVDASILLNQAITGMRDKAGQPLPNAHLIVLFNRLCKLLFYRVKPVFVFDGGVPILKKKTTAARRERKFKARYGSNKAAEKLVKNYLKGKALESVTGKRSGTPMFRSNSPREPDIFELPSISNTQDINKANSSSGSEDDNNVELSLLEEFYTQQEFENKYQDPSAINVESEDFRSLPEEIQHELIKDIMEERKWSNKPTIPQDSFSFSDYQLQGVLQRGKLHQRMDELRKNMNSRNTGEIAGLSSQNSSGADSIVLSKRIVSEDSGHYILVKRNNGNNDEEHSAIDNSTEGGFFHENQETIIQTKSDGKVPQAPTFDVDLTCDNSSDSELDITLMDVPEIDVPASWNTHKEVMLNVDTGEESNDTNYKSLGVKTVLDTEKEHKDVQQGCHGHSEGFLDIGKGSKEAQSRHEEPMLDIEKEGKYKLHGHSEGLVAMGKENKEAQQRHKETVLDTEKEDKDTQCRHSEGLLEIRKGSKDSENEIKGCKGESEELEIISTTTSSQHGSVQEDSFVENVRKQANEERDTVMEVEDSNIEKQKTSVFEDFNEEIESNEDEIQKRKRQIELLLKSRQDQSASSNSRGIAEDPVVDDGEARQTMEDPSVEFVLRVESSEEEEQKDALDEEHKMEIESEHTVLIDTLKEDDNKSCNALDKSLNEGMEAPFVDREECHADSVTSLVSQFAGSSKEDLEVMQVNLEMEQNSLQNEQARQERAAASVSNEMVTESQELLRLFGVPYLVSPMEAEAQCAFLDLTNQTHGTITDDSDIFLFGGQRVYKHLFNQNKHPELYSSEAINGTLALDRSKLIKVALITGSDYTEGIQGLGAVGAMEVLHEFNYEGIKALQKFKKWHDKTKNNKQMTQETKVKKKLRTITLPTGFPSQEVFDSYISPVIDESRESFEWGKPDLHSLRLFAKEKLGWTINKTDEILLPVLKQLNKEETQKRIDTFFQIKFQEKRKKSSKRVRRVVNRFLNPLSESSSDEEKNNQKNTNRKGKEKNKSHSCSNRTTNVSSRGQQNNTTADTESKTEGDGTLDQDLFDQSDGELERLINSETLNESSNNLEMADITCVDRKLGRTDNSGREQRANTKTPKGNEEIHKKDAEYWKQSHDRITQGDCKPLNSDEIHNAKNYRGKSLKTANDYILNTKECGFSGLRSVSEDSSTPSDTDSEEERKFRVTSGKGKSTDNIGGRGAGRKRSRGRGKGRGDRHKRTKKFPVS